MIIEYMEMEKKQNEKRTKEGELVFNQANINNVLFSTRFLKKFIYDHLEEYYKLLVIFKINWLLMFFISFHISKRKV